jgi:hypothetical protein
VEGASEPSSETKDEGGAPMDGRVVDGGIVEGGMLGQQGAPQSDQGRVGEIDHEQFGSDQKALKAARRHRFFVAADGALVFAG